MRHAAEKGGACWLIDAIVNVPMEEPDQTRHRRRMAEEMDSGKRYRGINVFLLGLTAWESGFSSDYWMTFNQTKSHGGQIRKGEKGSLVTFFKMYATKDKETGEPVEAPMLKHFTAFNVEQIDGIDIPDAPKHDPDAVPFGFGKGVGVRKRGWG